MRVLAALAVAAAGVGLGGCFTSGADYSDDAETYITDNESLRDDLFPDSPTTFVSAECEEPESSDVGETFTCQATDSEDGEWEFAVEILESNQYEVTESRRPTDTGGADG